MHGRMWGTIEEPVSKTLDESFKSAKYSYHELREWYLAVRDLSVFAVEKYVG
jgi:hypothetical protein